MSIINRKTLQWNHSLFPDKTARSGHAVRLSPGTVRRFCMRRST
jgi:hypothetical protein